MIFTPEVTGTRRMATMGPWIFGERLQDGKPMDKHLNLYLVLPGTQYRSTRSPEYDHTRVINKYTVDGEVRDWDIYYCFIIDPKLAGNFHRESELLVAAHQTFRPAGLRLSEVPSGEIMRKKLGVKSMADLRKYHRKGHTLPRLLILPAHLAVRATAELPDVILTHPAAQGGSTP